MNLDQTAHLDLKHIPTKFHENILNGPRVIEYTRIAMDRHSHIHILCGNFVYAVMQ